MKKNNNTCYSHKELKFMMWGQELRAKMLSPFLLFMQNKGITPNHLTILSLICGIAAAVLMGISKELALILIALHVIIDGIDGPLARYNKSDSDKGSFADTASDQIVIVAISLSLIDMGVISAMAGGIYAILYTVVVGFSMVRNSLKIPYSWLIRPRFLLYLWLPVEFYFLNGTTTYLLWVFNGLLLLKAVTGYFNIQKSL